MGYGWNADLECRINVLFKGVLVGKGYAEQSAFHPCP